jgi:predicted nucleic acid-binding protein
MKAFVDTSAFFAVLDKSDSNHSIAAGFWKELMEKDALLITTNYIILECFALMQNRLGRDAVRLFQEDILSLVTIQWVGEDEHMSGVVSFLTAGRRRLSLVDCVSFVMMRMLGLKESFCFDSDFEEEGFICLPKK